MFANFRSRSLATAFVVAMAAVVLSLQPGAPAATRTFAAATGESSQGLNTFPEVAWYAATFGISEAEAYERGQLQEQSRAIRGPLRSLAPDRLSAVWLQHEPEFKLIAWYTGDVSTLPDSTSILSNAPLPIEIRGGAPFAETEGLEMLAKVHDSLSKDIDAAGIGVEGSTATIVLELQPSSKFVGSEDRLAEALSQQTGASVRVKSLPAQAGDDTTYGGKRISRAGGYSDAPCTTRVYSYKWILNRCDVGSPLPSPDHILGAAGYFME